MRSQKLWFGLAVAGFALWVAALGSLAVVSARRPAPPAPAGRP